MYVCLYCICMYMCVYICVCMCRCVCVYIYIYIYIYIYLVCSKQNCDSQQCCCMNLCSSMKRALYKTFIIYYKYYYSCDACSSLHRTCTVYAGWKRLLEVVLELYFHYQGCGEGSFRTKKEKEASHENVLKTRTSYSRT